MTCRRTSGCSFFALKRVGVRFEGKVWGFGVPTRDTVGRCRFVDRGEEKIEGVGDDICIARTEEGVRKGVMLCGRGVLKV